MYIPCDEAVVVAGHVVAGQSHVPLGVDAVVEVPSGDGGDAGTTPEHRGGGEDGQGQETTVAPAPQTGSASVDEGELFVQLLNHLD